MLRVGPAAAKRGGMVPHHSSGVKVADEVTNKIRFVGMLRTVVGVVRVHRLGRYGEAGLGAFHLARGRARAEMGSGNRGGRRRRWRRLRSWRSFANDKKGQVPDWDRVAHWRRHSRRAVIETGGYRIWIGISVGVVIIATVVTDARIRVVALLVAPVIKSRLLGEACIIKSPLHTPVDEFPIVEAMVMVHELSIMKTMVLVDKLSVTEAVVLVDEFPVMKSTVMKPTIIVGGYSMPPTASVDIASL